MAPTTEGLDAAVAGFAGSDADVLVVSFDPLARAGALGLQPSVQGAILGVRHRPHHLTPGRPLVILLKTVINN
ncbi:hypothetical protein [Amycolatopsis sacchari]|uniref:hypothetical protein n=1 Tax=Amycolatopsis sacchari TaxID=115433 RepID=UPI003D759E7A